jgi:putative serine protease PepD
MTSTPDPGTGPADEQAAPVPPQQPVDDTQQLAMNETQPIPAHHTPAATEPAAAQPASEQPAAAQPASEQPAAVQPVTEQPAAAQPVSEQPAAAQPVAEQPAPAAPAPYGPGSPVPPPPAALQPSAAPAAQVAQVAQQPAPAAPAAPPFVPPAQQSQPYPQHTTQPPFGYGTAPAAAPHHEHQTAPHAGAPALAGQPGGPGQPADVTAPAARKRRTWLPIASAAAVAAIVGALATAGITHAIDDDHASSSSAFGQPASMATLGGAGDGAVPVSGSTNENPDWEAVANAVKASVVAITVTTSQGTAQGSGVVVDDKGHVVTNNHVVNGAQGDVEVTLTDGRLLKGKVVGTDATTDLAVVELEDAPSGLQAAQFGDSSKVTVGQPVMAVGNPLGLANTVTTGIVSAVNRPVTTTAEDGSGSSTVTNAIQIDAAINPGNSGGPLFDAQGRIIGINSSIATTSSESGSIGLGFAIPVDLVQNIAQQLVDSGSAKHAFLGVTLTDGTATADGVTRRGALVHDVTADSPASKAGIKANDVIVAIDGNPTAGADSLTAFVRSYPADTKVKLTVVRDGKTSDVDVTLAVRQEASSNGQQGQGDQGNGNGNGQQGQGDQGQGNGNGQQGQGDGNGDEGQGSLNGMTPDQLWQWFQEQQQRQGSGSGSGQG